MPWQNNNSNGPWGNGGGDGNRGGGNNPWGGGPRRGGGGGGKPPDFDEILRMGQSRLRQALPGGVGGGGIALIVLLVGLTWVAFSSWYIVQTGEQGVVLRFGEFVRQTGEGFHFKLPAPVETALTPKVETQQKIDVGFRAGADGQVAYSGYDNESLMLTGDENIVDVAFSVLWRIRDAGDFLFNLEEPQQLTIKAVAESAMREVIGQRPIRDALTAAREQIEAQVRDIMQETLDGYEAGILINEVRLERVDPPEAVIDAFRDVQAAEADRERSINEAEAYRNDVVPRARGEATKLLEEAEGYRQSAVSRASGEASRFDQVYEQYRTAKDVTRKRIYLETMEGILSGMDKVIIDSDGSGVVPYLPLPELKKRQGGN